MQEFDIKKEALGVVYHASGNFCTGKWNLLDEVKAELNLPKHVIFLDTTLREGLETPWVYYTPEQKVTIARALEDTGVSEIDCGFVSLSKDHFETLRVIKDAGLHIKTMAITRVDTGNPEAAIDMTIDEGADIVLVSIYGVPVPGFHTKEDYINLVEESVKYTKKRGAFCSFWVPFQHWEPNFAEEVYRAAIKGGADRIEIAGGNINGLTTFRIMAKRVKEIAGEKQLAVHCHNTMGTGTACALIGVECGAEVVHTSINGMSDGGGIASFEEVVIALTSQYGFSDLGIKLERLKGLSKMIRKITNLPLSPWKPVVGDSNFVETSASHLERNISGRRKKQVDNKAVWSTWGFNPEVVGQKVEIVFGPSGLVGQGIKAKAKDMGIELSDEELEIIKKAMLENLKTKGAMTEEEMGILINNVTK